MIDLLLRFAKFVSGYAFSEYVVKWHIIIIIIIIIIVVVVEFQS